MSEKFCYSTEESKHWAACRENRVPFVMIERKGEEHCCISFDEMPAMPTRGAELDYLDLLTPLYELYCQQNSYPESMKESGGGTRNGFFSVFAKDAEQLAEKLFDLLVIMTRMDDKRYAEKVLENKREIYLS